MTSQLVSQPQSLGHVLKLSSVPPQASYQIRRTETVTLEYEEDHFRDVSVSFAASPLTKSGLKTWVILVFSES